MTGAGGAVIGSLNFCISWRTITASSRAILFLSCGSRSFGTICSGKCRITRRRETPPLRSEKRIGLLFTARITAGIWVEYASLYFGSTDTASPPVMALSPAPSPLHFSCSGRRISEKPIARRVRAVIPAFRWGPMRHYLPRQAWSQFRPEYFFRSRPARSPQERAAHSAARRPTFVPAAICLTASKRVTCSARMCTARRHSKRMSPSLK